jgi:HSP20 family protein
MENKFENNDDFFVELTKAKAEPALIKVDDEEKINPKNSEEEGTLTVDVFEEGDDIVVQSTVAGVEDDDLVVDINSDMVTIKGERKMAKKVPEKNYLYQEIFWGKFSRSIILPEQVDPDRSSATLSKGILIVRMPKVRKSRNKQLKVSSQED